MPSLFRTFVLSAIVALPAVAIVAAEGKVSIAVQMTPEGRKVTPPTKEHPAYYFPVVAGFKADGAPLVGEAEPAKLPIVQKLAVELANQNYFVASAKTPPPTIRLVLGWGYVNPPQAPRDMIEVPLQMQNEMISDRAASAPRGSGLAVSGMTSTAMVDSDQTGTKATDNSNYFVDVSAYDYAAYESAKKKVLLWRTTMNVPTAGTTLATSAPQLITEGAPSFGHEKMVPATAGKVQVGTPTVVPPAAADAPKKP